MGRGRTIECAGTVVKRPSRRVFDCALSGLDFESRTTLAGLSLVDSITSLTVGLTLLDDHPAAGRQPASQCLLMWIAAMR